MEKGEALETQFKRLEKISEEIRNPEISLDTAMQLLQEGMTLSKTIENRLDSIETQIEIMTADSKEQEELTFEPYSSEL